MLKFIFNLHWFGNTVFFCNKYYYILTDVNIIYLVVAHLVPVLQKYVLQKET